MKVSNIYLFNLAFQVYAFVGILLVTAILYCVVVFVYYICDAVVFYHPVGGENLCDILDFYQGYLADLSKEIDVDGVVLEV